MSQDTWRYVQRILASFYLAFRSKTLNSLNIRELQYTEVQIASWYWDEYKKGLALTEGAGYDLHSEEKEVELGKTMSAHN